MAPAGAARLRSARDPPRETGTAASDGLGRPGTALRPRGAAVASGRIPPTPTKAPTFGYAASARTKSRGPVRAQSGAPGRAPPMRPRPGLAKDRTCRRAGSPGDADAAEDHPTATAGLAQPPGTAHHASCNGSRAVFGEEGKQGGCRRFCCPARLRAAGVRFCYRVRPQPCSGYRMHALGAGIRQRSQMPRCRWHLWDLTRFTGVSARAETASFATRRSCFGPARTRGAHGCWWSRRVPPPGPPWL